MLQIVYAITLACQNCRVPATVHVPCDLIILDDATCTSNIKKTQNLLN